MNQRERLLKVVEQDVLDADVVMTEAKGFFSAEADDVPYPGGEFRVHVVH